MNDQDDENEKKAPVLSTGRIMLVLIVIAVVTEVLIVISWYSGSESRYDQEYGQDYDYSEYFPEADASERGGMEYLTDDEVKEAGLPCTELSHFDISGESLTGDISDIIEDLGLGVNDTETSSYNQIYGDGGSWYETLLTYSLAVPGDVTGYQRLMLNYDTATGALHEIDLFISDKGLVLDLTAALLTMLGERTGTLDGSSFEEAVDDLSRSVERGENMYAVYAIGGSSQTAVTLTLYCFEDGYSVYIGRE